MPTASSPLSQARLRQIVQGVAASEHEWLSLVRYDLDRRWYQRLGSDDDHEVWLLSWLPGQRTGFHDHGESSGAFAVARGVLRERTAPGRRPGRSAAVSQGEVKSFGPWYIHDVINASVQPAVSVHVTRHIAYVGVDRDPGIDQGAIDVTDPAHPRLLAFLGPPSDGWIASIAEVGHYSLVADYTQVLKVYDNRDPTNLLLAATFRTASD